MCDLVQLRVWCMMIGRSMKRCIKMCVYNQGSSSNCRRYKWDEMLQLRVNTTNRPSFQDFTNLIPGIQGFEYRNLYITTDTSVPPSNVSKILNNVLRMKWRAGRCYILKFDRLITPFFITSSTTIFGWHFCAQQTSRYRHRIP